MSRSVHQTYCGDGQQSHTRQDQARHCCDHWGVVMYRSEPLELMLPYRYFHMLLAQALLSELRWASGQSQSRWPCQCLTEAGMRDLGFDFAKLFGGQMCQSGRLSCSIQT